MSDKNHIEKIIDELFQIEDEAMNQEENNNDPVNKVEDGGEDENADAVMKDDECTPSMAHQEGSADEAEKIIDGVFQIQDEAVKQDENNNDPVIKLEDGVEDENADAVMKDDAPSSFMAHQEGSADEAEQIIDELFQFEDEAVKQEENNNPVIKVENGGEDENAGAVMKDDEPSSSMAHQEGLPNGDVPNAMHYNISSCGQFKPAVYSNMRRASLPPYITLTHTPEIEEDDNMESSGTDTESLEIDLQDIIYAKQHNNSPDSEPKPE